MSDMHVKGWRYVNEDFSMCFWFVITFFSLHSKYVFFYFTIIIITKTIYYSIILFAQSLFVIITLLGVSGGLVRSDFGCLRFQGRKKLLSLHACSEFNG